MIGCVLWWLFRRVYGAGQDVTQEMLDGLHDAIREEAGRA